MIIKSLKAYTLFRKRGLQDSGTLEWGTNYSQKNNGIVPIVRMLIIWIILLSLHSTVLVGNFRCTAIYNPQSHTAFSTCHSKGLDHCATSWSTCKFYHSFNGKVRTGGYGDVWILGRWYWFQMFCPISVGNPCSKVLPRGPKVCSGGMTWIPLLHCSCILVWHLVFDVSFFN